MKLKLIIRYTSGTSQVKNIDPDDTDSIVEAMNATDFESLTLTRVRHPADGIYTRALEENHSRLIHELIPEDGC